MVAKVGPFYGGLVWGSQGGSEGALRAARARYGLQGANSKADLASAVSWADG